MAAALQSRPTLQANSEEGAIARVITYYYYYYCTIAHIGNGNGNDSRVNKNKAVG